MSVKPTTQTTVPPVQIIVDLLAGATPGMADDAWDELAVTAIVIGLAPVLHWHIEQRGLAVPPLILAKLGVTRQAHAKRNQAIADQLAQILAACHSLNIPVIVLKGAVLAPLAYPHPALRPMNDIDLLFNPADLPAVAELLTGLGYHGKYKDPAQGAGVTKHLSTFRRNGTAAATPNPYLSAAADRTVEPHGSLEESWFGLTVDITPGFRERAADITLHGQPARRLSSPDTLLHLTVHAVFHVIMGAAVFVQLYDIGQVITAWRSEINWDEVISRARAAQAQPFVYAGLYWAKSLFRAEVSAGPLTALKADCPPGLLAYIHGLTAVELFRRSQQPPLKTLPQRLHRGLTDRRDTARWVGSVGGKWRVWQTALAVHKTDTANLLLGRKLKTET